MFGGLLGAGRAQRERIEPTFLASSPENPSTNLADPASWLTDWASGGYPGSFGPPVSERTSMACSAVYRCVTLISGIYASLPLKVYKRGALTTDARAEEPDHALAAMFKVAPFPGRPMTAFVWRELWGVNELLWGNHYSIIRYDGAARIIGFEAVMPWDVEVYRVADRNVYRCVLWSSSASAPEATGTAGRVEWIDQDDMIHIPGPGFNGIVGLSRIRANARNSIALSKMLLEQIGRVHENAARPSGFVEVPPTISEAGFARLKAQFTQDNTGRANAGKPIFGDLGSKFTPFQMSPEDLNTIELMRFSIADISRFFDGVPLHLLNETDKSTSWGSGLSEQTLAFLIFSQEPGLGRIEAELNYKLFHGTDYYVEFDRNGLLAMDPVKAAQIAQTEIASGTMLINERRRQLNRPPVENGDKPVINSTNVPLERIFLPGAQPRQDPFQADPLAPKPESPDVGVPAEGEAAAQAEWRRLNEWKPDAPPIPAAPDDQG